MKKSTTNASPKKPNHTIYPSLASRFLFSYAILQGGAFIASLFPIHPEHDGKGKYLDLLLQPYIYWGPERVREALFSQHVLFFPCLDDEIRWPCSGHHTSVLSWSIIFTLFFGQIFPFGYLPITPFFASGYFVLFFYTDSGIELMNERKGRGSESGRWRSR